MHNGRQFTDVASSARGQAEVTYIWQPPERGKREIQTRSNARDSPVYTAVTLSPTTFPRRTSICGVDSEETLPAIYKVRVRSRAHRQHGRQGCAQGRQLFLLLLLLPPLLLLCYTVEAPVL